MNVAGSRGPHRPFFPLNKTTRGSLILSNDDCAFANWGSSGIPFVKLTDSMSNFCPSLKAIESGDNSMSPVIPIAVVLLANQWPTYLRVTKSGEPKFELKKNSKAKKTVVIISNSIQIPLLGLVGTSFTRNHPAGTQTSPLLRNVEPVAHPNSFPDGLRPANGDSNSRNWRQPARSGLYSVR